MLPSPLLRGLLDSTERFRANALYPYLPYPPATDNSTPDNGIPADTPDDTPRQISVSPQSFDSLYDNFYSLVILLISESHYEPNEDDLKINALIENS